VSRRLLIVSLVVAALVVAAVPATYVYLQHRREAQQREAAEAFAAAWRSGSLARLTFAGATGPAVAAQVQKITADLTSAKTDTPDRVQVESLTTSGDDARARLRVSWKLAGDRIWSYESTLPLRKNTGAWAPRFTPVVVHPDLGADQVLRTTIVQPKRGNITGAGDEVLVTERPVVVVGLVKSRMDDVEVTTRRVASLLKVDRAALLKRVRGAGKDTFVSVITLRRDAYENIRDEIQPIPGTQFQERTLALAPTSGFARALIGTVGPATEEIIKESKGRVEVGADTGVSGLQRSYDEQLAGTPGLEVRAVAATATTPGRQLFSAAAQDGKPLRTTLDRATQVAAEKALTAAAKPAALVAIRPSTGAVLAVANGGPNAEGYNRALLGRYPPGSTFKVASTLALLTKGGITPNTTVRCPATINVGGKVFKNAEDEVLGPAPFHRDFADSCNTAFVGSSTKITQKELAAAAADLGYGQKNELGVTSFTGQVPSEGDTVAHAAAMIGQGTVLASPVTVAGTAAAVQAGRWNPPRLVLRADEQPGEAPDGSTELDAGAVKNLRALMREVVTGGTATALRSAPGGAVSGKTGTAEYGSDDPPRTHAWFTGFQGDLAFAVVVEDGGFGAEAAVPLVKRFLANLS
jgi:cell division protein FtsI/penicillin-binding protein 2